MNFSEIRIEKNLDIQNPYELSKIGSPLSKREKDLIKKRIWSGFISKIFYSRFLDKMFIRKEDGEYYVLFDRTLVVVSKLEEVIELVYFEWCMRKHKYKKLRKYVSITFSTSHFPSSTLLFNPTLKNIVIKHLRNNEEVYLEMWMTEVNKDVVDLLNYIKAYY